MEDFKVMLVYCKRLYPSSFPQIMSFSSKEAAEVAIKKIEKSSLRNYLELGTNNGTGTMRTQVVTEIHRLYE